MHPIPSNPDSHGASGGIIPRRRLASPEIGTSKSIQSAVPTTAHGKAGSRRGYLHLLSRLDADTSTASQGALQERIDLLRAELEQLAEKPIGLLAPCHLGDDYEVHVLDLSGNCILAHFRRSQSLPASFEAARSLAASGRYQAIEVYQTHYRCIREDGSTLKVDQPKP